MSYSLGPIHAAEEKARQEAMKTERKRLRDLARAPRRAELKTEKKDRKAQKKRDEWLKKRPTDHDALDNRLPGSFESGKR